MKGECVHGTLLKTKWCRSTFLTLITSSDHILNLHVYDSNVDRMSSLPAIMQDSRLRKLLKVQSFSGDPLLWALEGSLSQLWIPPSFDVWDRWAWRAKTTLGNHQFIGDGRLRTCNEPSPSRRKFIAANKEEPIDRSASLKRSGGRTCNQSAVNS